MYIFGTPSPERVQHSNETSEHMYRNVFRNCLTRSFHRDLKILIWIRGREDRRKSPWSIRCIRKFPHMYVRRTYTYTAYTAHSDRIPHSLTWVKYHCKVNQTPTTSTHYRVAYNIVESCSVLESSSVHCVTIRAWPMAHCESVIMGNPV